MPFPDDVIGFTVAEFCLAEEEFAGFVLAIGLAVFAVETGFFVVAGFDDELVLLDDDELGFVLDVGFVVLDELLLFDEFVPLFDAMGALPFCLGVRACILASSDAVM